MKYIYLWYYLIELMNCESIIYSIQSTLRMWERGKKTQIRLCDGRNVIACSTDTSSCGWYLIPICFKRVVLVLAANSCMHLPSPCPTFIIMFHAHVISIVFIVCQLFLVSCTQRKQINPFYFCFCFFGVCNYLSKFDSYETSI